MIEGVARRALPAAGHVGLPVGVEHPHLFAGDKSMLENQSLFLSQRRPEHCSPYYISVTRLQHALITALYDRAIREQAGVKHVQLREWHLLTNDNDVAIGVDGSLLGQGEVPLHLFADMQAAVVAVAQESSGDLGLYSCVRETVLCLGAVT